MEEMFEILNEDGSSTGILKERDKVHADGDLHGAVHMWIYRLKGDKAEILIQKRSKHKDSWPGMYDISSAGHLDPGESFIEGAMREMKEELGISSKAGDFTLLKKHMVDDRETFYGKLFHNREIICMYLYEYVGAESDIIFQESEIDSVKWMELDTLLTLVKDNMIDHCIVYEDLFEVKEEIDKRLRLRKQLSFILEADKEKRIMRQTYKTDMIKENDAEHAWHLALMVMLLSEHSNRPIDPFKTMCMVLIHDIIEIDAGDTYAYDDKALESQREREEKAADRIFSMLPVDQGTKLRALWEEFEAYESAEACFAHTMDNLQPTILNNATDGISWVEHGVTIDKPMRRQARTKDGSERLWQVVNQILRTHVIKGHIKE